MPQTYNHRLTRYIHIQNDLGSAQKAKRAIYKACKSKKSLFQKGRDEGLKLWQFWAKEDQEIMMYSDADETTTRNAVIALRQARAQNNTLAISIVSSDTYFVVRQLSPTKQNEFHHQLLHMVVENGLSFQFIETRTFHEFVAFFNTTVKIPSRQTLSKKILKEYAEKLESFQVSALLETQEPATIMFDMEESTNRLYIWGAENISGTSQKTDNVLNTIRAFLECAKNQNLNVVAMVTDSTSSYASA
ncbi:9081_t:CDS:2, partial [Cetraspora pellucida]